MKVVLLERVKSVGNVGDIVNVSTGHARNYLIPRGHAVLLDDSNQKSSEHYQKMLSRKISEQKSSAESTKGKLDGLVLEFIKKVGPSGKVFGSVTSAEITESLSKQELDVERRQIIIDTPIKSIGTFDVRAHLCEGVDSTFQVKVVMDPAQVEEMKARELAAKNKPKKKKEEEEAEAEKSEAKTEEEALDEEVNKVIRS